MKNLVKNILSSDEYDGSVILFHQISGYSYFNMIDQKLKDKNIKKILIFNDTHTQRYINHSSMQFFDIMLFNSLTFVKLFYTEYLKKVHIYPFSLGYDFMKEINLNNRNNKILLYGSIGKDVYPLRTTMYNYYKNNKKNYLDIFEHFGSVRKRKHNNVGVQFYYRTLTKYRASIATSSKYPIRYLVAKYVEILGCGCLGFFEYHEELDILGFKPYEHYIPINTITTEKYITKDGLKSKQFDANKFEKLIKRYLGTPEGEIIRKNGYNFVLNNFSDINRFNDLINIITPSFTKMEC